MKLKPTSDNDNSIYRFIIKSLLFFGVWYVIYELWLLPKGNLDEWLSLNIIAISNGLIQLFGYDVWVMHRIIGINENVGIEIVNGCNGIAAIGLFLGFILAYPGNWKRRISFSIFGIGVIYLINIIRIVILVVSQEEWYSLTEFMHEYATSTVFYIAIFLLWVLWVRFEEVNLEFHSKTKNA